MLRNTASGVRVWGGTASAFFVAQVGAPLPTLFSSKHGTNVTLDLSFRHRQSDRNTVQNRPVGPGSVSWVRITAAIVQDYRPTIGLTDYRTLNVRQLVAVNGSRQTGVVFETNSSTWSTHGASFQIDQTCTNCTLIFYVQPQNWVSFWGAEHFFANITLSTTSVATPPRTYTDGAHAFMTLRKPVLALPFDRTQTACPHRQADLRLWHDPDTWPGGQIPLPGSALFSFKTFFFKKQASSCV